MNYGFADSIRFGFRIDSHYSAKLLSEAAAPQTNDKEVLQVSNRIELLFLFFVICIDYSFPQRYVDEIALLPVRSPNQI